MYRHFAILLVTVGGVTMSCSAVTARDGFILKCPPNNGPCQITVIPAPSGHMRWQSKVYVQGDGDLGRHRVGSRGQCQQLCDRNDNCVLAEYYFGSETRSNMCNLFSFVPKILRNTSGDAQVGIYD